MIRSRFFIWAFTVLTALLLASSPSRALAEGVVLYPVEGSADADALDEVEAALALALTHAGHRRVTTPGGIRAARPSTAAQMEGVGTAASARYVVLAEIEPMPGQYRLHITVGHDGRVEELLVNVVRAEEASRLDDVLRSMLRPEGLGDDAMRLSGVESDAERQAREGAERARRDAEELARREAAERELREALARTEAERAAAEAEAERQRQTEAERARQAEAEAQAAAARAAEERAHQAETAWANRPVLGRDGPWVVMAGVLGGGLVPLGSSGPQPMGGTVRPPQGVLGVGAVQARAGYALAGTDGLELRAGVDVLFGGTAGLSLVVGASYQFTPFVEAIHIGAVLELGVNFLFTGPRDAGFVARLSAIASFTLAPHITLEVSLPELGILTNGPGALMFGGSARIGYRF
jgi:hypothetical protein